MTKIPDLTQVSDATDISGYDTIVEDAPGGTASTGYAAVSDFHDFTDTSYLAYWGGSRTAVQSINDATWTAVTWTSEFMDQAFSITPPVTNIGIPRDGYYLVTVGINWNNNSTGYRAVRVVYADNDAETTTTIAQAQHYPGGNVQIGTPAATVAYMTEGSTGNTLTVEVFQESGGALDLVASSVIMISQVGGADF